VALVPIRLEAQILGSIHVADPRENAVPLESVQALEGASKELGTAIQRVRAEAALQRARDAMEQRVAERTAELAGANASLHAEIAERRRVEALLIKINRAYKALSKCNQAVIHVSDESALIQEVCRILREECGYRLVWIGFAEQDEARSVRPVAQAVYEEGYLDAVNVTWTEDERGCGPTGRAIRTRRPVVNRDILENPDYAPWRAGTPRPPPFRWPAVRGTPSAR
jgi:GAF domain-containing protein